MKTKIAIATATFYLFILTIIGYTGASPEVCAIMYLISPLIIISLVYTVLKEEEYTYPELGANDEWGYMDKNKNELGLF